MPAKLSKFSGIRQTQATENSIFRASAAASQQPGQPSGMSVKTQFSDSDERVLAQQLPASATASAASTTRGASAVAAGA